MLSNTNDQSRTSLTRTGIVAFSEQQGLYPGASEGVGPSPDVHFLSPAYPLSASSQNINLPIVFQSLSINPILQLSNNPLISYDLTRDPRSVVIPQSTLSQLAVNPPHPSLSIVSPLVPWLIRVNGLMTRSDAVTVADVLRALYHTLQQPVKAQEFTSLPSSVQRAVAQSFMNRCKRTGGSNLQIIKETRSMGVKRIDFLQNQTRFLGLTTDASTPNLVLHVGSGEPLIAAPPLRPGPTLLKTPPANRMKDAPIGQMSVPASASTPSNVNNDSDTMTLAPSAFKRSPRIQDHLKQQDLLHQLDDLKLRPVDPEPEAKGTSVPTLSGEDYLSPDLPPSPLFVEIKFIPDRVKEGVDTDDELPPNPSVVEVQFIADKSKEDVSSGLDIPPSPLVLEIEFIPDRAKEGVEPEADVPPGSPLEIHFEST